MSAGYYAAVLRYLTQGANPVTTIPGPFDSEASATAAARAAAGGEPFVSAEANLNLLQRALGEAGVETAEFDESTLAYLAASLEPMACAVVAGLVLRAYAAGREMAGQDGSEEGRRDG